MGIFKKSSVSPIVRSVISQGIEEPSQSEDNFVHLDKKPVSFPVDNDKGYMKMISGDNLNKILSKLEEYRVDIRQRRKDYTEHDAEIFLDGAGEMLSAVLDLITSHVENRTY